VRESKALYYIDWDARRSNRDSVIIMMLQLPMTTIVS
jgi:hypothetical protein